MFDSWTIEDAFCPDSQGLQNVVHKVPVLVKVKVRISFSKVLMDLVAQRQSYIGLGTMTRVIGCSINQYPFGCLEMIHVFQQTNPLIVTK